MNEIKISTPIDELQQLLLNISACQVCAEVLPHEPRPVLQVSRNARILIVGQAPGRKSMKRVFPLMMPVVSACENGWE